MMWQLAILLLYLGTGEIRWMPFSAMPDDAVVLERVNGRNVVLCRARLADGNLHPGVTANDVCLIPQKGTGRTW